MATMELLKNIDAETAMAKPMPGMHSIAELLAHMTAWKRHAIVKLKGDHLARIEINSEEDWLTIVELTNEQWERAVQAFDLLHAEFEEVVRTMTDEQLDTMIPDHPFTYRVVAEGVLDHDVYHGAQIVVVRRIEEAKNRGIEEARLG